MTFNDSLFTTNLWDLADYTNGRPTKPSELVKQGIPIIKIAELSRGISAQTNMVSRQVVDPKHIVRAGDLLFAWSGTIGIHTYKGPESALNQHIFKVVAKDFIDQAYLRYLLEEQLKVLQGFVEEKKTTMGHVTIANLKTVEVSIPADLNKQRRIASYIESIDNLLNVEQQKGKTLEAIAQTIFKSWFIDFDPVKAKMAGEKPAGMDAATAALFPNSMEESELGSIPKGWEVNPAAELFEVGIGRTPPRKEPQWFCKGTEGIPWVSIRDMGTYETYSHGTNEGLTQAAVEKFKVPIVPENTVLMSFKLTVGKLCISDADLVTNEAIAHFRISEDSPLNTFYTYLWLSNLDMGSLDSTSSIGIATNSGVIKQIKFLVPPQELLESFHEKVSPIFSQLKLLRKQTTNLCLIRDSLLPRLISGELQIPDEMLAS
jgi:type I restriction enzyme S subunit